MHNKRQSRHDHNGRKHPNQQGEYGKRNTPSFIPYQRKCLGGSGTRHQLTECIDVEQFFACNIFALFHKCFHHHSKMSLRSAKCRNAVKKHSPQKWYVTNQRQQLFFESDFSQTLIQVLSCGIIFVLLWIRCTDACIQTGE